MLRFLHMGDLHLGSALAPFDRQTAAAWRARHLQALRALLQQGAEQGAQLVLLAGDVFDTPEPDSDLAASFFSVLAEQPLPVIIAPGNHDFLRAGGFWKRTALPENVYLFEKDTLSCIDLPALGAAVYGYAFCAETMPSPDLGRDDQHLPDRVSILLAHADILSPLSPYAPITAGQLESSGFAYAALGHIHNPPEPRRYGKTTAAYSGFFAGRGFDEPGHGRALLVEIVGEHVRTTPLLSQANTFEKPELDLTGTMSREELHTRLADFLASLDLPDQSAVRVTLCGNVGLDLRVDKNALAPLGARFDLFEIEDHTVPIFDADFLEKDPSMRGAFYRAMRERLCAADEQTRVLAASAFRYGLAALSDREV